MGQINRLFVELFLRKSLNQSLSRLKIQLKSCASGAIKICLRLQVLLLGPLVLQAVLLGKINPGIRVNELQGRQLLLDDLHAQLRVVLVLQVHEHELDVLFVGLAAAVLRVPQVYLCRYQNTLFNLQAQIVDVLHELLVLLLLLEVAQQHLLEKHDSPLPVRTVRSLSPI